MAEVVLTWDVVEKNLELMLEKIESDEKLRDSLINLFETNVERYLDLLGAWERKNMVLYLEKWGKK